MNHQQSNTRPTGPTLTGAISVLISLSLLLSISWVGWESISADRADGLFISTPA